MKKEGQTALGVVFIFMGFIVLLALADRMGLVNGFDFILGIFLIIVFIILFILIIREIVMWYWKINKMVDQLEEQNNTLKEILKTLQK